LGRCHSVSLLLAFELATGLGSFLIGEPVGRWHFWLHRAGGGVMRDVLCAEVPLILRREIYATASIAAAAVYVLLKEMGIGGPLVAIRLDLHVPPLPPKDG
jgi:hypothetical protein